MSEAIARHFGRRHLLTAWIASSCALGAAGAFRNLHAQRVAGIDPERFRVAGLYALLIASTALMLSVPTAAVWQRMITADPRQSLGRRFISGVGWTMTGLLLATLIALVLDLANVPFIPIR
jgi:hypothetical protein